VKSKISERISGGP
jgi:hypothetical protein